MEREDGNVVGLNGVMNSVTMTPSYTGVAALPPPPQALTTNGYSNEIGPLKLTVNATTGTAGVRLRPTRIKKQNVLFLLIIPLLFYLNRFEQFISRAFFLYLECARTGEGCCSTCPTTQRCRTSVFLFLVCVAGIAVVIPLVDLFSPSFHGQHVCFLHNDTGLSEFDFLGVM